MQRTHYCAAACALVLPSCVLSGDWPTGLPGKWRLLFMFMSAGPGGCCGRAAHRHTAGQGEVLVLGWKQHSACLRHTIHHTHPTFFLIGFHGTQHIETARMQARPQLTQFARTLCLHCWT